MLRTATFVLLVALSAGALDNADGLSEAMRLHLEGKTFDLLDSINKTHTAFHNYHTAVELQNFEQEQQANYVLNTDGAMGRNSRRRRSEGGGMLQNARENVQQAAQNTRENVQQAASNIQDNVQQAASNIQDNVQQAASNIQEGVSNFQASGGGMGALAAMKNKLSSKFGINVGGDGTDDVRAFPRLSLESRYDDSSGMPGIASTLSLEFSDVVVIQVALNIEFGLGNGGTTLIAKLSTGIKTVSIPESCDAFERRTQKGLCKLAQIAADNFAKLFDLGGIMHPILSDSIGLFPFQLRFPGKFKSGLIADAYHLIDIPLFDFTREGFCLSTVYQMTDLKPMQVYTMKALAVLTKTLGGDICFETKANASKLEETGSIELGLSVKADLFDQSKVDFISIVDFLPDYMHVVIEKVRPALSKLLEKTQNMVMAKFPPAVVYEVDILKTLLEKLGKFAGGADAADLQEMMNTYTVPTPAPYFIDVGSSDTSTKVATAPVAKLVCPYLVSKKNWMSTVEYNNEYRVEVVGTRVDVTRTDTDAGWGMDLQFACFEGPDANNYRYVDGVGGWGGKCTCPDGQEYEVGDNGDNCESIACEGGVPGTCGEGLIGSANAGMKVTCAIPTSNWYRKVEGVGGWGGTCTCPDGQAYEVGDNGDSCQSLACVGGSSGECGEGIIAQDSQGMKVTCGGGTSSSRRKERRLSELPPPLTLDDIVGYTDDGDAVVVIPEVFEPGCFTAQASRRKRKLRGEKKVDASVHFGIDAGWAPTNLHPNAADHVFGKYIGDGPQRRLINQGLVTFGEGTGCTMDVSTFPSVLSCSITLSFMDKFELRPSVGITVDYASDGETLEVKFGLGFESSALPGEGADIPQVLVNLGNTLRDNMIDPGAMVNEVLKGAFQLPTEDQGFKLKFPAGEQKFHNLFSYALGKISDLQDKSLCFSDLLDRLSEYGGPDELAQVLAFITQIKGYIGGDMCIGTVATADAGGALGMKLMFTLEIFKIAAFDVFPLIKIFSTLNPAATTIWQVVEQAINDELKAEINQKLAAPFQLIGEQQIEFNIGKEIVDFIKNKYGVGNDGDDDVDTNDSRRLEGLRRLLDLSETVCGDSGQFNFGSVPASCTRGSVASGSESAEDATASGCGGDSSASTTADSSASTTADSSASTTGGEISVGSQGVAGVYEALEAGAVASLNAVAAGRQADGATSTDFCDTVSGASCIFPYNANGITFVTCTTTANICATAVDASGEYTTGGRCGACDHAPVQATQAQQQKHADVQPPPQQHSSTPTPTRRTTIAITAAAVCGMAMMALAMLAQRFKHSRGLSHGATRAGTGAPADTASSATELRLRPAMSAI